MGRILRACLIALGPLIASVTPTLLLLLGGSMAFALRRARPHP